MPTLRARTVSAPAALSLRWAASRAWCCATRPNPEGTETLAPLELLTLSGTLSLDGAHLHASVSDARGAVAGGHLMPGSLVRTTAEVVVALLPGWAFSRAVDGATGYRELVPRRL